MIKHPLTSASLLFAVLFAVMLAGCHIPFWPRLEIDSFPITDELIETMEVQGVVYVRVNNPAAAADSSVEASMWVPASVYQSGKYVATKVNLPQPKKSAATAVATTTATTTANQQKAPASELPQVESLPAAAPPVILPLRRRVLLFPTRTSELQPEIATLLGLELEAQLPLRVQGLQNAALREQGRLMNQPAEITRAVRGWLKNSGIPAPVQFVLFLSSSPGRYFQFHTCTWIDAQTGNNVATFTFRAGLNGRLILPLVPRHPTPLLRLIESTSWWCKIKSRPEDQLYILEAGHRSDLNYGHKLQVFGKAVSISDPETHSHLGFCFQEPLGTVSVVDFFAADGSLAQARIPLSSSFSEAWAVEIGTPDEESKDSEKQNNSSKPKVKKE